jgi:hypothetical protein
MVQIKWLITMQAKKFSGFLFVVFCIFYCQPGLTSHCSLHIDWLQKLSSIKSAEPTCRMHIEHTKDILQSGLHHCVEINKLRVDDLKCNKNDRNLDDLKEILKHRKAQNLNLELGRVSSEYKGYRDGLSENSVTCLRQFPKLKKDLNCRLLKEIGISNLSQKKTSSSWSDFWSAEKSKAPLADIPPWIKMGITTAASSVLWRYRGGGLFSDRENSKSGQRRLVTALSYAGLGYFNGGTDGAIAGALMYPGLHVPYGEQMILKKGDLLGVDQSKKWRDTGYMTGLGALTTTPSSLYLWARGYNPTAMLLGGSAKGLCYFGSWNWYPDAFKDSPHKSFVGGVPTQTAELCNGATVGAGLSGSLLYGQSKEPKAPTPATKKIPELCND